MPDFNLSEVPELVRQAEEDDSAGGTLISKYVTYNQRETLDKIDAYVNSKHISGERDSKNREKPFFNIVTAIRNIWYRATDIDRKDIKIRASKATHYVLAFVMTILVQEWMRKTKFGRFLNDWGRSLVTYGSSILKFVEKEGKLIPQVMPWSVMIVDPVDFYANPKIEKLWFTPAQLRAKKEYDQDMVEDLIEHTSMARELVGGEQKDSKPGYIELFEVHGELPESYITDNEEDEDNYVQQMHVISYVAKKENAKEFDNFTLYRGREKKDPYMITHLIEEDGRTVSIGSVESLFQAQWMTNHSVKSIKDQLDLASKLIFQTADPTFVGQNALEAIETGDIMIHKPNMPLTQLQNNSHDISALQGYQQQWTTQANVITGVSESMMGIAAKSGTAWRQTQAELQEAHSLFELMVENKSLAIEEMFREFVIPHLKTKMDNKEEISAILAEHNVNKLDSLYLPAKAQKMANDRIKKDILNKTPQDLMNGNLLSKEDGEMLASSAEQALKKSMSKFGNQRFLKPSDIESKTWKEMLKDFEWDVEVEAANESKDVQAVTTTLNTVLQTIAGSLNPQTGKSVILENPKMKMILNKILELTGGLSSVELESADNAEPTQVAQPVEVPQLTQ